MSTTSYDENRSAPTKPRLVSLPRAPLTPLKKLSARPVFSPCVTLGQPKRGGLFGSGKLTSVLRLVPIAKSEAVAVIHAQDDVAIPEAWADRPEDAGEMAILDSAEQTVLGGDVSDLGNVRHESSAPNEDLLASLFSPDSPTGPPAEMTIHPDTLENTSYRSNPIIDFNSDSDAEELSAFPSKKRQARSGSSRTPAALDSGSESCSSGAGPSNITQRPSSSASDARSRSSSCEIEDMTGGDMLSESDDSIQISSPSKIRALKLFGKGCTPELEELDEDVRAGEREWMDRYYDDSQGSLRDFIVDDDDEDDEEEHEEGEADEPGMQGAGSKAGEPSRRRRPRVSATTCSESDAAFSDSAWERDSSEGNNDDDDDGLASDHGEEAGILEWSPGPSRPRPRNPLLDLEALRLSDSEDSEGDEQETPAPAGRGTKGRARRAEPAAAKPTARAWGKERIQIAEEIFAYLDRKVFDSQLGATGAGTKIVWSNRLLTTAGTASENRRLQADGTYARDAILTLSMKVCTGREQVISTVAHEMCHSAFIISNERKIPHGRVFKSWGQKVMRARPDIEVTTKHSYQIEYKYQWQCSAPSCGRIYKRHSKSIDVTKQACGRCRGKLRPMFVTKENPFKTYLKNNMALAKAANPLGSHGEVMRALSRRWTEAGPTAEHEAFWRDAAEKGRLR